MLGQGAVVDALVSETEVASWRETAAPVADNLRRVLDYLAA
jgi:hypothetical protein